MRYFTLLIISVLLFSCQKEDSENKPTESQDITLVYMIADNDLASYAIKDINEMERGFTPNGRDKLLVYIDTYASAGLPHHPVLLEIVPDQSDEIKSKILYSYSEQNSADKHVLASVLKDAFSYYKGNNSAKGLILWSHGNAWLPEGCHIETDSKNGKIPTQAIFKSFGKDNVPTASVMEISDLAEALHPYRFEYILFDACFMASVEVLYELRHSAQFFIASPAEILADGFPYHKVLPYLMGDLQLEKATQTFYDSYAERQGVYQSATITLIESRYLDDLALLCKKIVASFASSKILQLSNLQQYSRNKEKLLFDLKQILSQEPNFLSETQNLWQKLCKVELHTASIANMSLFNCNGLSTYLFNQNTSLNEFYKSTSWYKACGLASFYSFQ